MDFIEAVEGPTLWLIPVEVVPKAKEEIRLCVDICRANEAIIRERHPIATLDEVLHSLNQRTVFIKLDLGGDITKSTLTPINSNNASTFTYRLHHKYPTVLFATEIG